MDFHKHVNEDGEVLIIKRIPQNRKTHGEFLWPSGIGTFVECPDWNPEPKCGGGLHGCPWGWGLGDSCDYDIIGDIWLVLGAQPEDIVGEVENGCKCKARKVAIRLEGSFKDAMEKVAPGFASCVQAMAEKNNQGDYSKSAAQGYSSKSAAQGDSSKSAAQGDYSKSAAQGDYSKSAAQGYSSKSAAQGDYSKSAAQGNYSNSAAQGYSSKSAAQGYSSKSAAQGDYSTAEAIGENTLATVLGHGGKVRVGERGAFALAFYTDADGWRFLTGKVGENGIQANKWYEVKDGIIVEIN